MNNEDNKGGTPLNGLKLAQAANGIAQTVRGAVAGGLPGAAVSAAKAFAPQLIKVITVILLTLLLLPSIIFYSIPNMLWQWPSSGDPDIEAMNIQAEYINDLYKRLESFAVEEADTIVRSLSSGYDDVVVSTDLGGISRNWLIAINSVMHEQEMGRIGESNVRNLVRRNLDYSYTTDTYEVDTGMTDENGYAITETKTRIKINMWTITPYALMDKLGFTDFQTKWAGFIYDNINDSQLINPGDPDYIGELVNYGDLVFTSGSRDVVYYNQTDERWGNKMYGKTHTIAVAGCGPTALAMVVSSMTETVMNPQEMSDWAYENGYCAEGNGSYHALIPDGGKHFGLNVTGVGTADGQKIIDALGDGKLVIALMGPGHFTVSGHFIVLRGVTSEGNILVADPVSVRKTDMEWDMRIILDEASGKAVAGGPFWICG